MATSEKHAEKHGATLSDPEDILTEPHLGEADFENVKKAEVLLSEAEAATEQEHRMGLIQALRTYPKASAWSIAISFAVVMEGLFELIIGRSVID